MKALVISHGDFAHACPYMRYMVRAGWDVHWLKIAPGTLSVEGVTPHAGHGEGAYASELSKLNYLRYSPRCRRLIRRIAPDVIHAHYASSAGLVAWLSGQRPYAVTIHGTDLMGHLHSRIGRAVLAPVLRGAGLVNPVAPYMVEHLVRLGVREDRVFVRSIGIELPKFPFQPRAELFASGLRVLCNRSLEVPLYDIPTIMRALAKMRQGGLNATLSLPAGGRLAPPLRALAGELGIEQAVQFGAGFHNEDVPAMMATHDVYVSAALWDGASLSLLEAMACGAFPVVSDTPANREWLEHERNGLLFPPGHWQRLAELLRSLPQRRELIARALRRNRELVEARADRCANLGAVLDRLGALCPRRRAASNPAAMKSRATDELVIPG